jgi:hypothetical protein
MCPLSYLLDTTAITGDFTIEAIHRDPNNPYDAFCLGASSGYEWDKKTPNIKYLVIEHKSGMPTIRHGFTKLLLQIYYGNMHDRTHILISDFDQTHSWRLYFKRIENAHHKVAKFLENQFERKASKKNKLR